MTPKTLTRPQEEIATQTESQTQCAHHWIIAPPDQPTSQGICKLCGAEKEFENFVFPERDWK